MKLQEIPIDTIENIKIGHAEDVEAGTGCTVLICEAGAPTGLDVRGGGPASRESELLNPLAAAQAIHAVLLSGGSAFGLDAAGGVMDCLQKRDIGFDTGIVKVPLVCQSCIFDLGVGRSDVYPDRDMARRACEEAFLGGSVREGNVGAGMGATVGKYKDSSRMMKSGLGCYAVAVGELKVGAVVSVNALGDIFDIDTGRKLAGMLCEDGQSLDSTEAAFYADTRRQENFFTGNTTIGAVITNAAFTKSEMNKIAAMAQNGLARAINPVHTTADGDSVYAMSAGSVAADINVVGTLAARVLGRAVGRAVLKAQPAFGLKTASMLLEK
ncbi:MAG: P1 family peptidase [Eubacterium sp.]|nr:P1 family peptidase [Eubacterium sp.]